MSVHLAKGGSRQEEQRREHGLPAQGFQEASLDGEF